VLDEAGMAAAQGIAYEHLPIAGAGELTVENARLLDESINAHQSQGTFLVHCASANRAAGLLCIRQVALHGSDLEASILHAKSVHVYFERNPKNSPVRLSEVKRTQQYCVTLKQEQRQLLQASSEAQCLMPQSRHFKTTTKFLILQTEENQRKSEETKRMRTRKVPTSSP